MNRNELYHYGVKGMKWGIRRYQNIDGSYTAAGQRRHDRYAKKAAKYESKATNARFKVTRAYYSDQADYYNSRISKKAFANVIRSADRYKARKHKADKILSKAEAVKTERQAQHLAKKGKKLIEKTLKDEEILQTSINTLSKQMDEHTKANVDRWMVNVAKDLATMAYSDGTFTYVWTDPAMYRENLNYASYASYTANSRRKKPE